MKNTKRCLAWILVLCLLVSVLPTHILAAENTGKTSSLTATELPGVSRLEDGEQTAAEETAQYADDEMVTVIVLMDDPAVMDYFGISSFNSESNDLTAGEAVSGFLASDDAQALAQELMAEQETVIDQITSVTENAPAQGETEVLAQWTGLINGVSVRMPYGQLEQVKNLSGVKAAYVEQTFDRPDEELGMETQIGTAGYSYDLAGISSVWGAGYYGEGMVVAVLDTGLDLEYSTWGDSANPQTGIRRVHEAFTEDSFRTADGKLNVRYTESAMKDLLEKTQLNANTGSEGQLLVYADNALYKNRKVPFAFDYSAWDVNVRPEDGDHGTHVAGTIAGYAATEEGEVTFSGIAPDAQILAMKVFDDYGSSGSETAILCALEDAAVLGADVVNLSLGSDNGFAVEDTAAYYAYASMRESGILFMISAGNSGYSSVYNNYGDNNLSSNPETSMVSTPSTYGSAMSIASMDNVIAAESILKWTDTDGTVTEAAFADPFDVAMKNMFAGENVAIIPVDGYGTQSDYYNAGFRSYYGYSDKGVTGIALVKRGGGLSFEEKINNATNFTWSYYNSAVGYYVTECPVKAVIIYDEDPNATELIYMSVDSALLTSCFISGKDGADLYEAAKAAIAEGKQVTLTVQKEDNIVSNDTGNQLSSFTSWGAAPGLELKPDITAPGGNIWSAVLDQSYKPADSSGVYSDYVGSYGMMSGTSMAAPHMTGITALVKQYAKEALELTGEQAADLTEQLLVSTAVPMSYNGVYYSPRAQGAGLVNAGAAVSTPAYITVEGQNVGKLELKDDPEKTGEYTLTFQVNNLTGSALTYSGTVYVLRPDTNTDESGNTYMLDSDVLVKEVPVENITVPANGTVSVSVTVTLTDGEKAELDKLFPNGTYIEGFVVLSAGNGTDPQIGLPFLAFYGDWTSAPIFDSATWMDEDIEWTPATEETEGSWNKDTTWGVSIMGYFDGYAFYNLGQNPFDSAAYDTQTKYLEENITVSPTGLFKSINDATLYQLRDSKLMVVEVRDKETGKLYYSDVAAYLTKTVYNYSYGVPLPWSAYYFTETYWDGTDLEGNVLPSGTECVYTITAYGDGEYPTAVDEDGYVYTDFYAVTPGENEPSFNGHAMDKTGDVISFNVQVDTVAPKLENSAVTTYVKDGRTYITGTFKDDGSIASVEIYPQVKRSYNTTNNPYADPSYAEYGLDNNNPFYTEMIYDADVQEWIFTADVTEYVHANESYSGENYYYNFDWTGNVFIYGGDYGGNDRAYGVTVTTGDGLILSTTSAKLNVGGSFDLNVINNTGSDAPLTRTSTHPEVATVDEFGHIEALAPGQTEIVVSNGTEEVVCIVAVQEQKTEVIDFKLSLESFDGLKPDGSLTVKVTDLEPADVTITENIWMVYENDPEWAGLLTVEKGTSDGMSGKISLTASLDDGETASAGSGYLEVTINGVTRKLELSWDELYESSAQDGLISDAYYNDQVIYVEQGETAELVAKYRQTHSFINVELYTMEGYQSYSYNNPTTACTGLVLDGPTFTANGAQWTGKLVALPGYELPEDIKVVTRYDYGYESEMYRNSYYGFTYDSTTGEIVVKSSPYGATNTLVIRADGVAVEGAPGGTVSGIEYTRPDGTYGPFDWTVTSGSGELTLGTIAGYYENKDGAFYTPSEPGVSYITATSKDGNYSIRFAVVCTGVQAESVDLEENSITLNVGDTHQLNPALTPEPTLDIDKRLVYTSFNEAVVTVDENGMLTAVAEGYAYICVEVASGVDAETYCVVHVLPCEEHTYGEWTQTKAPECGVPGEESRSCTKCGHTQTRTVDALTHSYGEWEQTKAPGCETAGEESRTCSHCGGTETREVAAVGHSYTDTVTAPTATEKGYTTHTCSGCGHSYVDSYTEPVGGNTGDNAQTGDRFHAMGWFSLLILSAGSLVILVVGSKKRYL